MQGSEPHLGEASAIALHQVLSGLVMEEQSPEVGMVAAALEGGLEVRLAALAEEEQLPGGEEGLTPYTD